MRKLCYWWKNLTLTFSKLDSIGPDVNHKRINHMNMFLSLGNQQNPKFSELALKTESKRSFAEF